MNSRFFNRGWLESLLADWGDWWERKRRDQHGLPREVSFIHPHSGEYGHKILCAEMPPRVSKFHSLLVKLNPSHYDSLFVFYGVLQRDDGSDYTHEEKARDLEISLNAYRLRVSRARRAAGIKLVQFDK